MSKFRCPYCFEEHELEDCVFVCPKDKCPRGFKNDDGSVSQQNLSYCLGRCKHAAMQVSCPEQSVMDKYRQYVQKYQISAGTGTDLSLDIPESIRKGNKTLTVAIVGGVYSGKSTYITTLINKLDVELNNKFGTSLSPLNTATEELYRQRYSNYIYKSNTVNDKTRANETIPPLMYRLEIPDERFLKKNSTITNAEVRQMFQVSSATANRILSKFTEGGKLQKIRIGRSWGYQIP